MTYFRKLFYAAWTFSCSVVNWTHTGSVHQVHYPGLPVCPLISNQEQTVRLSSFQFRMHIPWFCMSVYEFIGVKKVREFSLFASRRQRFPTLFHFRKIMTFFVGVCPRRIPQALFWAPCSRLPSSIHYERLRLRVAPEADGMTFYKGSSVWPVTRWVTSSTRMRVMISNPWSISDTRKRGGIFSINEMVAVTAIKLNKR